MFFSFLFVYFDFVNTFWEIKQMHLATGEFGVMVFKSRKLA